MCIYIYESVITRFLPGKSLLLHKSFRKKNLNKYYNICPIFTGLHRYIFLVYRQSGKQEFDIPLIPFNRRQARRNHKVRTLVVRYGLQELVAGNFYQAEYDDYVPIARSTLVD